MSISFGLITDIHIGADDINGRWPSQVNGSEKLANMSTNLSGIDMLFSLGGNAEDEFGGTPPTSETNLATLKGIYSGILTTDQHFLAGNHDLDTVTKLNWIAAQGRSVDVDASRAYYSFDIGDYHFIILDPLFDSGGTTRDDYDATYEYYIPTAERTWLAADLAATDKRCFVFCHLRFDVADSVIETAHQALNTANGVTVRTILENSGKVEAVFSGHIHSSDYNLVNGIHYFTLEAVADGDGVDDSYAKVTIADNGYFTITAYGNVDDQSAWAGNESFQLGGSQMSAQIAITVPAASVDANLTAFPLLVTDDNLPARFWASVKNDGTDIWFLASDGTTKLDAELAYIDVANEKLEIYVATDLNTSTDTSIFMNYGNSDLTVAADTGVWDSNFVMVQHLDSISAAADSTSFANDGTTFGTPILVDGLHGKAIDFDDGGQRFEIAVGADPFGIAGDIDQSAGVMIEAVIVLNTADLVDGLIFYGSIHNSVTTFEFELTNGYLAAGGRSQWNDNFRSLVDDTTLLVAETRYHVAVWFDYPNDLLKLYVNGVLVKSGLSGGWLATVYNLVVGKDPTEPFKIGSNFNDGIDWNNIIEEVRVSKVVRTVEWLKATYDNYFDTANFYSAAEKMLPANPRAVPAASQLGGLLQ